MLKRSTRNDSPVMSEFIFDAQLGKRVAKRLAERRVDHSLVANNSSIRNETPSNTPGNFGNDVTVLIRVREEDDATVTEIQKEVARAYLEVEKSFPFWRASL